MSIRTRTLVLVALVGLAPLACENVQGRSARAELAFEIVENSPDGWTVVSCSASAEVAARKDLTFWGASPGDSCGLGRLPRKRDRALQWFELTATPVPTPGPAVRVETVLSVDRTGVDGKAAQPDAPRTVVLREGEEALLPLRLGAKDDAGAGPRDAFVRLRARAIRDTPPTGTGQVLIRSNVGSPVRVDLAGEGVGRVPAYGELSLLEVPAGTTAFVVRYADGGEDRREITVVEGQPVEVQVEPIAEGSSVPLGANAQGFEEFLRTKDRAVMIEIPAGEFLMGSPPGRSEADERPQRAVQLPTYLIDKYETTWRQFRDFARDMGEPLPTTPHWGVQDHFPVTNLTWQRAADYCEWAGGRLPTEAEWEKAARGTEGRVYPWGEKWDESRCNNWHGRIPKRPVGVGTFSTCVSPYGAWDMAGNVWEWCSDWYDANYYAEAPVDSPSGPATGRRKVLRGGAWFSLYDYLRAARRYAVSPGWGYVHYGIRCVTDPDGGTTP